jgi:hypothetical protein
VTLAVRLRDGALVATLFQTRRLNASAETITSAGAGLVGREPEVVASNGTRKLIPRHGMEAKSQAELKKRDDALAAERRRAAETDQ